ncbi:MAG: phenylalanine--tRNA ligase subunit beta [Clostridia bacterium]|nr:phenylalanine--tRNA ligase subunit beta [Clostridia bacterium]
MKVPFSWLKEYVDIDCSVQKLEEKLFSCGFEVEESIYVGKNIDKIVSCKILSIDKHPNADKLSVTKVDAGEFGIKQIITSAKNIFEGAIVPVALDGATLANGERIFNGELRGVPSEGMFCSGEELGINDDWYPGASVNGILILNEDYPLGVEVKKLLEIEDVVFDINVTANRSDCQSILGIAREVAAALNKPFKMPDLDFDVDKNISTKDTVSVNVLDQDLCQRYISWLVKDIKIEQSPLWLKRRLFSMGIRSINNIVDITNYVLMEIGQPMHAFDLNDICGNSLIIRRANNGEKIITLDDKEFSLINDNLVICDANKPVALAGVMGGLNSEIKQTTSNVLFESATFARDNVRKTSKALGQRSDSSARFEKGVDLYSVEVGIKRALNLICRLNCGKIACNGYDICAHEIQNKVINTTVEKVNGVLGIDVPEDVIKDILTRLNFEVELNDGNLSLTVPLYREDMEDYPDIAEEIIREYGYDNIVPTLLKTGAVTNGGLTNEQQKEAQIKEVLVGYGFNEIITYSFVSEKEYDQFGFDKTAKEHEFIKLINPLGEDLAVMRTTLLPSIVRAVAYNLKRKNFNGRLFELAKVYNPVDKELTKFPVERQKLSIAVFGDKEDFFTIKGYVDGMLNAFCSGLEIRYVRSNVSCMHPTRSADVYVDGVNIGYFGQLHPSVSQKLDIDKPVYCCEIDYSVLKELFQDKLTVSAISKFPPVERDLAILVDENVCWQDIVDAVNLSGGEFLSKVKLFDIYRGDQVEKGKKSVAFNLIFVSSEKTLVVEEVEGFISSILKCLREKLGAELR